MAIRFDTHEKAIKCLERARYELEAYDALSLAGPPLNDREIILRRTLTDIIWAVQLTLESISPP